MANNQVLSRNMEDFQERNTGIPNEAFSDETFNEVVLQNPGLVDSRKYHSDTSLTGQKTQQPIDDNADELISELRCDVSQNATRTRHRSQPTPPSGLGGAARARGNRPARPIRSMVNMDGIVYDPAQRKFLRRNENVDSNDPRGVLQGGGRSFMGNIATESTKVSPEHSFNDTKPRAYAPNRLQGGSISVTDNVYTNQPDLLNSRNTSGVNVLRNGTGINPEVRSLGNPSNYRTLSTRDAASLASIEQLEMPASTPEEKNKVFRSNLTTVLSCIYGVLLISVGIIIFILDIFVESPIAEIYCIYLASVGYLYLVYLFVDLRIFISKAQKHHKEKRKNEEAYDNMMKLAEVETLDGPLTFTSLEDESNSKQPPCTVELPRPVIPLEHPYCFSQGRHAGSFYLKLGAAVFCLGHLIHGALMLSVQATFLQSDTECGNVVVLVLDVIYPMYSFCQLFFIFKYSNVIILKSKELGHFALMHCIASSLCFWIWTIIRETMDTLKMYAKEDKVEKRWFPLENALENMTLTHHHTPVSMSLRRTLTINNSSCSLQDGVDLVFHKLSPYLYPFTIEYSILIVGIFYILWQNIGKCPKELMDEGSNYHDKEEWASSKSSWDTEHCKLPTAVDDNGLVSNLVIHVDCHSANKGLFGGILIIVLTVFSIIMGFINVNSPNSINAADILMESTDLVLHLIMLVAVVFAYACIRNLDVNPHPISLLDDLLLFISIPAFFMKVTFTFIPAVDSGDYFKFCVVLVIAIQVLVQTPFITDALRRCSNTRQLQRTKPGRELITFLIVCNVCTWIYETFSVKNAEKDDHRYEFYGKVLWTILGHITTPLCMFYRFHSSVCLVDIWKGAYQPGNNH